MTGSRVPAVRGPHALALGLSLALAGAYFAHRLPFGWIASDSGVLAQSAARVLHGEVPHRDFDEYYTGGLTLLNAGAMALLGERLVSTRWALLAFALAYLASLYRIAARVAGPAACVFVTLCAAIWSVPNYFVPLPTWYNLFFTIFGLHALLRYLETDRKRWLFVSGLMAGLSFLIKIVSLYVVAAALFTLLYREQRRHPRAAPAALQGATRLILAGGLLAFLALLLDVLASRLSVMVVTLYLLPPTALVAFLLRGLRWSEPRWTNLSSEAAIYGAGVLLPVAAFVAPFALAFGMWELIDDVVLMPRRFFGYHGAALPDPSTLLWALPWGLLFALGLRAHALPRQRWWVLVALAPLCYALLNGRYAPVYQAFWASTRPLFPIVVAVGCVQLARVQGSDDAIDDERLFALIATAGTFGLVQFPFSAGIYFCFASGVLLLAGLWLVRRQRAAPRRGHSVLLAFYAAFALAWLNHADTYMLGWGFHPASDYVTLEASGRGGIRIPAAEAAMYERVIATVQAHARPGQYVYSATDAPEIAFLADRPNPLRTMFDVLDPDYADAPAHAARVLSTLARRDVPVVVLNVRGGHSGPPRATLVTALERRYPAHVRIGRFEVRWR